MDFADATKQGSAYIGLVKILRDKELLDAITIKLAAKSDRSASVLLRTYISQTYMLKTEATERSFFQDSLYFAIVGFSESANLPMIGKVHVAPYTSA